MIKRDILDKILPWIGKDKILILKGSRQVGKTTLLRQIEQEIKTKDNDAVVVYLSADDLDNRSYFQSVDTLELFLSQKYGFPQKFVYLMIDEFQVIPEAGLYLKNIFDRLKGRLQLIVSGSSSLEITKNSEFLTGRALNFIIDRITFFEYACYAQEANFTLLALEQWKDIELFYSTFADKLILNFHDYLIFGGYPEVITTQKEDEKKIVLSSIAQTYIEKDIVNFLKVENVNGFNSLLKLTAEQVGNLLNVHELTSTLSLATNTIKKYLDILSGTYILDLLRPYSSNLRIEISKMPKVFLLDLGLRNYLLHTWSSEMAESGRAIENFIYLSLLAQCSPDKIYFYRTISGAEIDFVIEDEFGRLALCEVKYREKISGVPVAMHNMEERYAKKVNKKIIITKRTLLKDESTYYVPAVLLPFIKL